MDERAAHARLYTYAGSERVRERDPEVAEQTNKILNREERQRNFPLHSRCSVAIHQTLSGSFEMIVIRPRAHFHSSNCNLGSGHTSAVFHYAVDSPLFPHFFAEMQTSPKLSSPKVNINWKTSFYRIERYDTDNRRAL